jgi:uncharacterized protein (TIGR00369 family)
MTSELSEPISDEDWGQVRSRTVQWRAPALSTAKGLSMQGINYLRAILGGQLPPPPINALIDMDVTLVEPGRVAFAWRPDESMYNATGTVHGGMVCTLLDAAAGCALLSTLPQGNGLTSIEIKVNYLKVVHPSSGILSATGTVVKAGSRVGFTEAILTNASGAVVATASSTLLIFDV